ncbi:PrsW family intramembrane metalloprotease [Streptomyces radicis]|uniref:Protease PrsW n=1 Tax=Streptomyces radicis TaxID=1750517 RepID=A0A3A9WH16_9ACTN|nr:PrsW family intramembrane metalloprotease [Streptomyces radicis]RKN11603.1 protease PrsW [Streptomyces radicis]RKN26378.1 protease PrsW [Streptomyces radicis]
MRPSLSPTFATVVPLVVCGLIVSVLVWRETGAPGFLVGLGLALLPVPVLIGVFHWVDALAPRPWRPLAFAFGWGACVATLFALLANNLLVSWLTDDPATIRPTRADTLELTVIAPVVEETAKAVAVLLLFLHRPRAFHSVIGGVVTAGLAATGFAFTENVLYLGNAFTQDSADGGGGMHSGTLVAFFVRIVMAPLAHPMFTVLAGIGLGLAATLAPHRPPSWRWLLPLGGLALAMGLHSAWNAAASLSLTGFGAVYGLVMMPAFCVLCWLVASARQRQLRVVRKTLPLYAAAGWVAPGDPEALASLRARSAARRRAREAHGSTGWRAMAGYQAAATSLALLRHRAERGAVRPDFVAAERELLSRLAEHRAAVTPPVSAP